MAATAVKSREHSAERSPTGDARDKKHMRTYQACVHCRKRKVKCELGDTENPQPPCARCTREQKQCTFTEERRRKRGGGSDGASNDGNESEPEGMPEPSSTNKRVKASPAVPHAYAPPNAIARPAPLRLSSGHSVILDEEPDPHDSNRSAVMIQSGDLFSQNDALQLLYKAAQHHHNRTNSTSSVHQVHTNPEATPTSHATSPNGIFRGPDGLPTANATNDESAALAEARAIALQTWSRFRFVRAGWIKAEEGIAYVEYFYEHLYPLTPITVPDYRHPATHKDLLESEPILALTLLTIASRYMNPPGPGATSRGPIIHDTLTNSLQKEINRTVWGQKQFGGGFCRAGAGSKGTVNHLWQMLGTVEALMLLTEWHPRSLHFPPGDDDGELLIPEGLSSNIGSEDTPIMIGGPEGRRVDAWLEPCWRSDRMCWMLLSIARALAFEIGVFDDTPEHDFKANNPELSEEKVKSYFRRKNYLKSLLPIYAAVTSGRLELTKNIPRSYLDHLKESRIGRLEDRLGKLGFEAGAGNGATYTSRLRLLDNHPQELVIHLWQEISYILNSGNKTMYPNRKHTAELVANGQYVQLLQYYQPMLNEWHRDFLSCKTIPTHMRCILLIEFQYSRAFLYLLALHAVYSRCTRNTPMNRLAQLAEYARDGPAARTSPAAGSDGAIPANDIRKWMGLDSPYISEVVDACRQIFKIVTEGLLPDEYLKHCPVRTYFRIISAALILLKTFVVGATENEMAISLDMMDGAVQALRTCIVDDVHVGNHFADMCSDLNRRIRHSFVRMSVNGGSGTSRAGTPPVGRTAGATLPSYRMDIQSNPVHHGQGLQQSMHWGSMNNPSTPGAAASSGRATPNHHVWGASKDIYDPSTNNMSILPAPNVYYSQFDSGSSLDFKHTPNNGFSNGASAFQDLGGDGTQDLNFSSEFSNGMGMQPDWLTLPFDGILNSNNEVIATPNGPAFGQDDMLDRLLWTGGT